ncbi:MAG: hypothetical protein GY855_08880 [candidate division Zixibacteria bacterium]|nr:hypothetical protein [candidate division Zixibacteria bacterium]
MKPIKRKSLKFGCMVLPLLILAVLLFSSDGYSRTMPKERSFELNKTTAAIPNTINVTHRISNIWFTVTNWGYLGSAQDANTIDCETGQAAPSCVFPAGSNLEYLFQGAIWVGAIVDGDTLVSCGTDGWWDTHEFFPDESGDSTGEIWLGSTRPATAYPRTRTDCYPSQIAESLSVSEEDFIAYYADTNIAFAEVDPIDARPLRPIYLELEQKSYSWSYEYAEDFILFDYKLTNIGDSPIQELWMAFHVDADVHHTSQAGAGAQDDMTGFLARALPIESIDSLDINTAYIMDNDGDPDSPGSPTAWTNESVRGLTGTRVVRLPEGVDSLGFNWWISNVNALLDWGPQWLSNFNQHGAWPGGGRGTPGGDPARYTAISNFEFDYDQAFSALDFSDGGEIEWIGPLPEVNARDIANGFDTRYTYSFGPFPTVMPGDSLKLTVAYIAGEELHVNPSDFNTYMNGHETDSASIVEFIDHLNFNDFALNATWADWVYDNPGVDTDGDGYFGEFVIVPPNDTVWIKGDTHPDFAGPPPPPSPGTGEADRLIFDTEPNRVKVDWNGQTTEYTRDSFGNGLDFEGYRIYRSRSQRLDAFTLLGSYDRVDYDSMYYDPLKERMVRGRIPPRTITELLARADTSSTFQFAVNNKPPYFPVVCPTDPNAPNTSERYNIFVPHSDNTGCFEDTTFTQNTYGNNNIDSVFEIHSAIYDSTTTALDPVSGDTLDIHHYSMNFGGVLSSVPYFYSITAFDYGDPRTALSPLESSKAINMTPVYAIDGFDKITDDVYVFPNPYILGPGGSYRADGWEDLNLDPAYSQRIYFANIPPGDVIIRIFTLDGDLVDKIEITNNATNADNASWLEYNSQPIVSWDLISRNTQSIVSGLYMFSVDSDRGRQIGKFVIIK